jgi:hypothetical protein
MEPWDIIAIGTRLFAAAIWSVITVLFVHDESPAIPMVRWLVMSTLLLGLWFLVIGAFTTIFELADPAIVRWLYTIYTAFASIVGLAILTGPWRRSD